MSSNSERHVDPHITINLGAVQWAVGTLLYFAGMSLWLIVFVLLLAWLLVLSLPVVILWWLLGVISGSLFHRSQRWDAIRDLRVWEILRRDYFQYELRGPGADVLRAEMGDGKYPTEHPRSRKLITAVYPHGLFSVTATLWWGLNPKLANTTPAVHSWLFKIPLLQNVVGWAGCTSVAKEDLITALNTGSNRIVMCPGGIDDVEHEGNRITKRRGIFKLAEKQQAHVLPVWVPEERDYYTIYKPLGSLLKPFLRRSFPLLAFGLWWCPFMPRPVKTRIYVGAPIHWDVPCGERYYRALEALQELADADVRTGPSSSG